MLGNPNCKTIIALYTLFVSSGLFAMPIEAKPAKAQSNSGAQERPGDRTEANGHFGFDLLQMLLEDRGLQISGTMEDAYRSPKQSVIVITGAQPAISANNWERLIGFVLDGGALLLASDNSIPLTGIGHFSRGPVTSFNPSDQYQGFSDCLKIVPNPEFENLSGVSHIVTNRSGWFIPESVSWLKWDVLASFPVDSRPVASRNGAVLAIGRWAKEDGIAIMSADAGLFSNGMMWHGYNAIAAIRVSEMLCSGGRKTQLVFFADGQVMDSYRNRVDMTRNRDEPPQDPPVPEPELKKALRLANAIAKEVAESNVLNEALRQRPRGVQPSRYFRAILYIVAILVLLAIIWALLASGTLQAMFLAPRRMRSAYEMREHASSLADDFRNSAGFLARDFCWELTGSRHTADWQKYLAELMSSRQSPHPAVPKGLYSNRPLPVSAILTKMEQHELMKIIDIACRGCHARMTSQEFQLLGNSISKLRSKHRSRPLVAV